MRAVNSSIALGVPVYEVQMHPGQERMVLAEASGQCLGRPGSILDRSRRCASSASTVESRGPAASASSMARTDAPVMLVATEDSLTPR